MCTTGAILGMPEHEASYLLAFKTLDSGPTGVWHTTVHFSSGTRALALGSTGQQGINSGLNDRGLTVILSYLDIVVPDASMTLEETMMLRARDTRTLANALLLDRCSTVAEGADFLDDFFRRHPSAVGGNHILADTSGTLGCFEHCGGEHAFRAVTGEGLIGRGNDGCWVRIPEQRLLPQAIRKDRARRSSRVVNALTDLRRQRAGRLEAIAAVQRLLADHGDGPHAAGSVCCHGVDVPGARYATTASNATSAAIVIDVYAGRMLCAAGAPCRAAWAELTLTEGAYALA